MGLILALLINASSVIGVFLTSFKFGALSYAITSVFLWLLILIMDVVTKPGRTGSFWLTLSKPEFSAYRDYHLYLSFPGFARTYASLLYFLGMAGLIWAGFSFWKGQPWVGGALIAYLFLRAGTIGRLDPVLYLREAAKGGQTYHMDRLELFESLQEKWGIYKSSEQQAKPAPEAQDESLKRYPRPFHENKSKTEYEDWFSKTKPWNSLDPRIISAFINRLSGDAFFFELFVHVSRERNLIEKYALPERVLELGLVETISGNAAAILFEAGNVSLKRFLELWNAKQLKNPELTNCYTAAGNAYLASINVEPKSVASYGQLALLRQVLGKNEGQRPLTCGNRRSPSEAA